VSAVRVPAVPGRIASLIASGTEILAALGLGDRIVGVSHECDFPAAVADLPRLSAPKVDPALPGAEIDREVRRLAAAGEAVYRVDRAAVDRLKPDLIVTQDVCDVCAVGLEDVVKVVADLRLAGTEICELTAVDLAGVLEDFRRVGRAAGVPERGEALADETRRRLEAIAAAIEGRPRPRVALLEWLSPPMVAGGWIPELARIAGLEPVIVDGPATFVQVTWDDIAGSDPDLLVIMPCGFTVHRTLRELDDPDTRRGLERVPAFRRGRGFLIDGHSWFNRPGPRLVEGLEVLASRVHEGFELAVPPTVREAVAGFPHGLAPRGPRPAAVH